MQWQQLPITYDSPNIKQNVMETEQDEKKNTHTQTPKKKKNQVEK